MHHDIHSYDIVFEKGLYKHSLLLGLTITAEN